MKYRWSRFTTYSLALVLGFWLYGCAKEKPQLVEITTNEGKITLQLYEETAQYRKNFVQLVEDGFYDSLLFHRVIPDMIIQGGDPESKHALPGKFLGRGELDYTIQPDFQFVHTYGAVSGARKPDSVNPTKKSSGSQFFIVMGHPVTDRDLDQVEKEKGFKYTPEQRRLYKLVGGIPSFDKEYSVFGEVKDGMNVVKNISRLSSDPNDRPVDDVRMYMKIVDNTHEQ